MYTPMGTGGGGGSGVVDRDFPSRRAHRMSNRPRINSGTRQIIATQSRFWDTTSIACSTGVRVGVAVGVGVGIAVSVGMAVGVWVGVGVEVSAVVGAARGVWVRVLVGAGKVIGVVVVIAVAFRAIPFAPCKPAGCGSGAA